MHVLKCLDHPEVSVSSVRLRSYIQICHNYISKIDFLMVICLTEGISIFYNCMYSFPTKLMKFAGSHVLASG